MIAPSGIQPWGPEVDLQLTDQLEFNLFSRVEMLRILEPLVWNLHTEVKSPGRTRFMKKQGGSSAENLEAGQPDTKIW